MIQNIETLRISGTELDVIYINVSFPDVGVLAGKLMGALA